MTDHRDHGNHDQHDYDLDPAHLDQVDLSELRDARDAAADAGDLVCAVRADNALEDRGALGTGGRRRTCRSCGDWADHVHDPVTGERMRVARFRADCTQADVTVIAHIAARVFALASAAPPEQWEELAVGVYRITVVLDTWHYEVILPIDAAGRPRPAYIDHDRIGSAGGPLLPVVYANRRATTAIAEARQYLTRPART